MRKGLLIVLLLAAMAAPVRAPAVPIDSCPVERCGYVGPPARPAWYNAIFHVPEFVLSLWHH